MSGFSADWLALREPYDLSARNSSVLHAASTSFVPRSAVRIMDLACGTGSTLRALGPHLPVRQDWTLIDNDPTLLERVTAMPAAEGVTITAARFDLSLDLEALLDSAVDLVTNSALLDLVSQTWLDRLATALAARAIPLYAALNYDGRISFTPHDPFDAALIDAVNAHQRTDKGFGPALGPAAASYAITRLEALGYAVTQGASDWVIRPDDRDMQGELLAGWAGAAHDTGALPPDDIANWLRRRRDALIAGSASLEVGHVDFSATPSSTR